MRLRGSLFADEHDLRALDRETWSPTSSPAPTPTADRPFFGRDCVPEDALVAVDDDVLIGYVRLSHPTSLPASKHVFEIRGLVVRSEYRRMGVATVLLDAAARDASARGGRRLTLRVLAGNLPARGLYERYGFKIEGVLQEEFRVGGRYVDDVLMALALGGSRSRARLLGALSGAGAGSCAAAGGAPGSSSRGARV